MNKNSGNRMLLRQVVPATGAGVTLMVGSSGFSVNGGAVSFYLIDNFAVNFGAVHQRASIDQDEVEFTVAGVTVAVGFSVLLGGNQRSLALTFLFDPTGWLFHLVLRAARSR